jgi:hypothetical protein
MSYYDNQESVANIYVGLVERGWNCFGYKADESDSMTDYWSPARWEGIAEKNGFVLLVDVYSTSQSGYKVTKKGYTPDYSKIAKLQATIDDKASSQNEKEMSQKIIDNMMAKQEESTIVVSEYPTFKNVNPKGCNWHIEKDGNIIAKGKGAFQCDGYLFGDYRQETMKKVFAFIDKIETKILGSEQLQAVQEKVVKTVIKPVEVTDRTYIQVGDILTFEYHGHFWFVNSVSEKTFHYELLGSEKRGYQKTKNGKRYYDYMTNFNKGLENGKIKIYELKEVEEVTYKTVYKTVKRQGQKENLLTGEVVETVQTEAPKKETVKENKQTTIVKDESIQVEMKLNDKLNGIELYFTGKPSEGTRELLKENGFRWSKYNKCWYSKQSDKSMLFAESLVSAYNDNITDKPETIEDITEQPCNSNESLETPVNDITEQEEQTEVNNTITEEQSTTEQQNPYNSECVITPNGYYCYFKAWEFEPEQITELLQGSNIPFTESGEKFFFQGITVIQFKLVQMINKENGSILWDDSNSYEETTNNETITAKENKNGKVLDFSSRFKAKQEKKEMESMTNHFIDNVLPFLNNDELIELQKAYNSKNTSELDSLWQRLMMITAVRRVKHDMLKEN